MWFFGKKPTWSKAEQAAATIAHDYVIAVRKNALIGMEVDVKTKVNTLNNRQAVIRITFRDPNHLTDYAKKVREGRWTEEEIVTISFKVEKVGRRDWKFSVRREPNYGSLARGDHFYYRQTACAGFFINKETDEYVGILIDLPNNDEMCWFRNGTASHGVYGEDNPTWYLTDDVTIKTI